MAKLPVIDFSKEDCLKPGISSWLSICNDVCRALEELGCFEAIMPNDVYSELQNNIFAAVKDLFDAPSELKPKNRYEGNPYCGHFTYNIVMKFAKYKEPKMVRTDEGPVSHTDKSFSTILHQNLKGLKVNTRGDEFGVKTEYDPAIIESTRREMMNQDSIGLFAMKVGETNTLEELVDEDIKQ
ncbi:unnamed protein product [Malus baccata var. baccata]